MPRFAWLFPLVALPALALSSPAEEQPRPADVQALQDQIQKVIARAEPSIVCVLVSRSDEYGKKFNAGPPDEGSGRLGEFERPRGLSDSTLEDPGERARELRRLLKSIDLSSPDVVPESFGSGVVLDDKEHDKVLTNAHVVRNATKIFVRLPGGQGSWADVHAADPRSDLAVLRLLKPPDGLKPIRLGDGSKLQKGQFVVQLANPFAAGFRDGSPSASWGIVSNLQRRASGVTSELEKTKPTLHHYGTLIQTDVRIALGCSGGALLNLDGDLVGLTTAQAALAGSEAPGGYAVPIDAPIKRIVEVLLRGEEVEYGFLGVQFPPDARPSKVGVTLTAIADGSPAKIAGLDRGDVITAINDAPIHELDDLFLQIGIGLAGGKVRLDVLRNGAARSIDVVLAKSYVPGKAIAANRPATRGGLRVDYSSILSQKLGVQHVRAGVAVREVVPDSPADKERLQVDYVITNVNARAVTTPKEFYDAMDKADGPVKLTFRNFEGREDSVTIRPK
jgi:S1-C subfamily serine protease